ncbi:MAG TPA: ABC transporter substrate-binding protein [Xanthobacteraceae bacterium]|nr:ABC transporter substrate-binding protein [Xanthobacteraceae bacterium]
MPVTIGRREVIAALGAAAAWPLAARAQQTPMPVVGLLWVASERVVKPYEESIRSGLHELGWVDGGNFRLEVRYGSGEAGRLPELIDELIALNPRVLSGISEVVALMKAKTSTIPIVLSLSYDPVESGLVQSLARPGGNITGIAVHYDEVLSKHVEIASELVPGLARIGFINDAADPGAARFDALAEKAASSKGLTLVPMPVRDRASVEAAYAGLSGPRTPDALIVMLSGRLFNLRDPIREGALKLRAPVIYPFEGFVEDGGLVSYGPNYYAAFRRSTVFVDKILRGAKPADLPIEQPTRLDLVVNMKAAEAIGLAVTPLFLARADKVIE